MRKVEIAACACVLALAGGCVQNSADTSALEARIKKLEEENVALKQGLKSPREGPINNTETAQLEARVKKLIEENAELHNTLKSLNEGGKAVAEKASDGNKKLEELLVGKWVGDPVTFAKHMPKDAKDLEKPGLLAAVEALGLELKKDGSLLLIQNSTFEEQRMIGRWRVVASKDNVVSLDLSEPAIQKGRNKLALARSWKIEVTDDDHIKILEDKGSANGPDMDLCFIRFDPFRPKPPVDLEDPAIVRARLDVKSIEQAVTAYYLINGMWPQDLVALTKPDVTGRPPLIKAPLPKDPWGNDYIYQPQNLNPKTDRPLIYSEGPPGHIIRITNWD